MIDARFIEYKANSYKEEPESIQMAAGPSQTMTDAGPTRIELTGMATPDKTPRVGRAGVPYQVPSLKDAASVGGAMLDMGASAVKGATQGFIGLPGDIEGIGRLILGKMGVNVDEATALPTTEEVKTWLDTNLGSVAGGKNPYESIGEIAAPGGQIKAAKAVAKGAKALAPKAAEMVMDVTEKTGMPVRGLGIVESGSGDALRATAQASDIGFYSAVEQAALNIQRKSGTGQAMLNDITKGQDVKLDEVKWIGLDDFLKGKKNVSREEVQQFIAANKVDVQEVALGAPTEAPAIAAKRERFQELADKMEREDGLLPQDMAEMDSLQQELSAYPNPWLSRNTETRYDTYTIPGGENYREILLTMPSRGKSELDAAQVAAGDLRRQTADLMEQWKAASELNPGDPSVVSLYQKVAESRKLRDQAEDAAQKLKDQMGSQTYKSSHFDESNILAHIRVNDRVDADGKKMLLIEEVQSDWHQAGREKGYHDPEKLAASQKTIDELKAEHKRLGEVKAQAATPQEREAISEQRLAIMGEIRDATIMPSDHVPNAPMKDTWYQLALKRALKYATDNGYERVGLTTGKQQADRFDLSKPVDNISYEPTDKGFFINVISKDGRNILNGDYSVKELEGVVGKEVTQKMIAKEGKNEFDPKVEPDLTEIRRLEGVDLKVGGEGMKKYYDEIYPQFLAKYGKKWNATVGETRIKTGRGVPGGEPVRYIDITPSMKESVGKGQPLFSATGLATGAGAGTMATSQQEPK
jgi:hypothetical protein